MMIIRPFAAGDEAALWQILEPAIRAGETYALARDMGREATLAYWTGAEKAAFVAEAEGRLLGTYVLRANHPGGGSHVANCGYITAADATGRGVARTLCAHSLAEARARGFRAMQFNFVVSTNHRAVRLWQAMGFAIAGTLPGAFRHPTLGYVDVYVMFQAL